MSCLLRVLALLVTCALSVVSGTSAAEPAKERRAELLTQMRALAEATKIGIAGSDQAPQLEKNPVFRYDDQPRRFIDATIWAWTNQGTPVALQKIEARL